MIVPAWQTATLPGDAVEIGTIGDAWGVKGWVRVWPHGPDCSSLLNSPVWYLKLEQNISFAVDLSDKDGMPLRYMPAPANKKADVLAAGVYIPAVEQYREQGRNLAVKFAGITERNWAEKLKGCGVYLSRQDFAAVDNKDEFYWVDLIGLAVVNRQNELLGVVKGVQQNTAQSLLQIEPTTAVKNARGEQNDLLIPFVKHFIIQVELKARKIIVDWQRDY